MIKGLIRLARPKHWIKNVFVLIPLPFVLAAKKPEVPDMGPLLLGLLGFCLINSAIYTLNDLMDAEADRLHPKKRRRPLASGEVSPLAAGVQILVLLLLGFGLCTLTGCWEAVALSLGYVGINIAYSAGAKHVAVFDVFLLSSGFVIRVLLGCALVGAVASSWLLLCTTSVALFLGFTKRRADLLAGLDASHRPSLEGYSRAFLDQAITICAGVSLLSYALYSIDAGAFFVEGREMASMPFVAYGIFNYLRISDMENAGGSPVEIAFTSLPSQICAVGWIAAILWSLGMW